MDIVSSILGYICYIYSPAGQVPQSGSAKACCFTSGGLALH